MKKNPLATFKPISDEERAAFLSKLKPGVTRTPYTAFLEKIITQGEWVANERTGKKCLTIINHDFTYDVCNNVLPLDTTRTSYVRKAIMELVGYIRGFVSAKQFRDIGVDTWDENTNESEGWLNNPFRTGPDDMGGAYGEQLRAWKDHKGEPIDQLRKVYEKLCKGIDDRGLILLFLNPGIEEKTCLRPCLFFHQFSILGGKLYLNSVQRSCDGPLGLNFNQVQCFFLLAAMSKITGIPAGEAYHKVINGHIYEDQIDTVLQQLNNEPYSSPSLELSDEFDSLEYLDEVFSANDFKVSGYQSHGKIAHQFAK